MGLLTYVVGPLIALTALAWVIRFGFARNLAGSVGAVFRAMPLTAAFGLTVVTLYVLGSVFAPVIAPYGESQVFDAFNLFPGDDPNFILGTDQLGRDLLTRLLYGGRNTIGIALITTFLAFLIGATLGFLAAAIGGWLDQALSRGVDVLMAIPQLIFALLLITILGQSTINMILVIAVLDSTRVFRLARAVGANIVVMDYIEAAKLRGEGLGYLIFKEILPNAAAPLLAEFGLRFCFVFLLIAALSFLGIGIQPPLADWGTMVRELSIYIGYAQYGDWQVASLPLLPAAAIALLTVSVNFIVDWMLDRYSGLKN
ncbi:ABC transporter permease [Minwuia sp.]|uniref:ABC transporter permease n=1 Tax=Minwuia sp. TaxID=2493630 RepID=UPI003A91F003